MKKNKRSPGRSIQKRWPIMIILPLFLVCINPVQAFPGPYQQPQNHLIKGEVTDTKGTPLPGVTIRVGNTTIGVASDNKGHFTLNLPMSEGTLTFSCVGYKTRSAKFRTGTPLSIRLEEEIAALDEVQVIAYGQQSKREMTGAMSIVKAEEIKDIPSPSISNLLQGRVSGMNVVNAAGAPGGGGTSITIRGYNSLSLETGRRGSEPLWVIDGVPMHTFTSPVTGLNALAEIDPADIESIQVLKDAASAAIYGSRAANGVILLTTKKGRLNQKARFSINISQTFSIKTFLPEQTGGNAERRLRQQALENYSTAYYDKETNTYRYPESWDEALANRANLGYYFGNGKGKSLPALQDSLNKFYNNSTNMLGYYFRPAQVTDANIQIAGGAKNISYNIGLGYYTERGTLTNTGFNRIKLLSNLYVIPFAKVESNLRFYLARTGRNRPARGRELFTSITNEEIETIPKELINASSLYPGKGTAAFEEMTKMYENVKEENESYRLRTSFDMAYEILPGLKLKSSLAADYSQQNLQIFKPAELDEYNETVSSGAINRSLMWLNENTLNYNRTFNGHSIDLLAGLSFQADWMNSIRAWGKGNVNQIEYIGGGLVYNTEENRPLKNANSDMEEKKLIGTFFRVNYNYRKKYLVSISLRCDGSSTFGENNRWGTFPSFAAAYAFSEENFMKELSWLSYGKLRISWGVSGKHFNSPYLAHGIFSLNSATYNGHQTVVPEWTDGFLNKKLSWEETRQWDIGLDADLWDHRVGIVFDWYRRYTDKMLATVPLPDSPFKNQWRNAYGICNSGVELQLKGDIIRKEKLTWTITFNIARNWNKLVESNNGRDFKNRYLQNNLSIIGKPLNQIMAYQDNGYYNQQSEVPYYYPRDRKQYLGALSQYYRPGDRKIADLDGDGTISARPPLLDDRKSFGSPLPIAQGGISSNFTWKGFDLNLLFNYMIGRHILNAARNASIGTIIQGDPNRMITPVFADLDKVTFWEKPGDHTDLPANRADQGLNNFSTNLSSNVEKVNFLRLKTLTLGYTLPEPVKKATGFDCRIFLSGENLFVITNYSGSDPESVDLTTGIDYYNNYPLSKRLTIGITLNF